MQESELRDLSERVSQHYSDLLHFQPRRISFELLTREQWITFCRRYGFSKNSEGTFIPRNLTAYLLAETPNLPVNLFHELFGHGLYFEYSEKGQSLQDLELRLMREERRLLRRDFTMQQLAEVRANSPMLRLIRKNQNDLLFESFAIWTEEYLSGLFGFQDLFKAKYPDFSKQLGEALDEIRRFQANFGEACLFYELGFPKYRSIDELREIIPKALARDLSDDDFVLVYGSRKPYSDVDIFVVSEEETTAKTTWLDCFWMPHAIHDYKLSVFDVAVTDPLFTGELISGNADELERKRKKVLIQPITNEAIYYNIIYAREQAILADRFPRGTRGYTAGKSYSFTYRRNALALKQGKRLLTKRDILEENAGR